MADEIEKKFDEKVEPKMKMRKEPDLEGAIVGAAKMVADTYKSGTTEIDCKESCEPMAKSMLVRESTLTVMRTIPKSMKDKIDLAEEDRETLDVHKFVTTPAMVEVTYGKKKQIEKFEPVEIRISVSLPCYKEEIDDAYEFLQKFVTDIMMREMISIGTEKPKADKTETKKAVKDEAEGRKSDGGKREEGSGEAEKKDHWY